MKNKSVLPAMAYLACLALRAEAGEQFRYAANNGSITINGSAGYQALSGGMTIPGSIDGLPVTHIGDSAFYLNDGMTSVNISSGVTVIGNSAFMSCNRLTSVVLPDSLKQIGFGAFSGCSLTNLIIPSGVTNIGTVAFSHCSRLNSITVDPLNPNYSSKTGVLFNKSQSILLFVPDGMTGEYTIPDSVIEIDDLAFQTTGLSKITVSDSVSRIGSHGFYSNYSLTNVVLGKNVSEIGGEGFEWMAFSECPKLLRIEVNPTNAVFSQTDGVLLKNKGVILIKFPEGKPGSFCVPDSTTEIEEHSFSQSTYLTGVDTGKNVNSISREAFENCPALTNVTFGGKLKTIGEASFSSCKSLAFIAVPDNVTRIEASAFYSCASLKNVTIGKGVSNVGDGCFSKCPNLTAITVDTNNATYGSSDGVLLSKRNGRLLKCPEGKRGAFVIPAGIAKIGDESFSFSNLTNIIVPKSVKSIEGQAFLMAKTKAIYFEGDAPKITGLPKEGDSLLFVGCDNLTIYYKKGTHGWKSEFAGCPTATWE